MRIHRRLAYLLGVMLLGSTPPAVHGRQSPGCALQQLGERTSHSMAYDPSRRQVVMFGGSTGDATNRHPSSLWGWDGERWNCVAADGPPGRADAFLEYDRARNRLVLFGGRRFGPNGGVEFMTDTWEWDGRTWVFRDRNGPGPRIHGAAVYDSARKAVLIHGGAGPAGPLSDTWEWNGSTWRDISLALPFTGNANAFVSTARGLMVLGADRHQTNGCGRLARARLYILHGRSLVEISEPGPCFSQQAPTAPTGDGLILFAGWPAEATEPPESWTWTTGRWHRTPSAPTRRRGAAVALDEARNRVVLYGGNNQTGTLGDTWEFDGRAWSPTRSAADDTVSRHAFPKLHGEAIGYDRDEDRLVIVGGRTMEGSLEGTWVWDRRGWRQLLDASKTPPQRAAHAMAYNPDTRQMFLFGGMTSQPVTLLCDTWILENTTWRAVGSPICLDGRVRNASLVYDSAQKIMLLVSGPAIAGDAAPRPTEIWRWMVDRWVLADRSGPRREGFASVAFDSARSVLVVPVLYGGADQGTWEWNGSSWRRSPAPRPSSRQTYSVTFDARQQQVVLVGGQGSSRGPYLDDVWTWDGTTWQQMTAAGGFAGRAGGTLTSLRSGDLLYAGGYNTELLGELWTLSPPGWRQISSAPSTRPAAR